MSSSIKQPLFHPIIAPNSFLSTELETSHLTTAKSTIKPRPVPSKRPGFGKWSLREQLSYIDFLQKYWEIAESSYLRKTKKVFLRMSRMVRTRCADQCRSHHQKMKTLHGSAAEIVRFYRQQVFPICRPPHSVTSKI
jgi:hypothetical protein